ncbi:MAG: hypothetical protein AAB622_03310 [Patescibacteria group bacterium]
MPENGRLIATNIVIKLPCEANCPFRTACATKYRDGTCIDNVDSFIEKNVYGTPGKKLVSAGQIKFTTEDPAGKVTISEGTASISRSAPRINI